MQPTIQLREQVLDQLDRLFARDDLARRAQSQTWTRSVDNEREVRVHVNVGVYADRITLLPSVALRDATIQEELRRAGVTSDASASTFSRTLPSLSGRDPLGWTARLGARPRRVARSVHADVRDYGLPFLDRLLDRGRALELLESDNPNDWCVPAYGQRIRLLPLLLASLERIADAHAAIERFEVDAEGRDQVRPAFPDFAAWFREHHPV